MIETVDYCLITDSKRRPDIDMLGAKISPKLLDQINKLDSSASITAGELQRAEMLRRRYRTESATHRETIRVMKRGMFSSNSSISDCGRASSLSNDGTRVRSAGSRLPSRGANKFQPIPEGQPRSRSPYDQVTPPCIGCTAPRGFLPYSRFILYYEVVSAPTRVLPYRCSTMLRML